MANNVEIIHHSVMPEETSVFDFDHFSFGKFGIHYRSMGLN